MPHQASIKGIVTDSNGQPLSEVIVMVTDGPYEFPDIPSVSNEKGEFYLSNIYVPGRYRIQFRSTDSSIDRSVQISSENEVLNIVLN